MQKVIFDTNIYIDWINVRKHEKRLKAPEQLKCMSAIVALELYAGSDKKDSKLVDELVDAFVRTNRFVVPSPSDYIQAGQLLRRLQREKGYDLKKSARLVNDVLIALTARRIGALLVTKNRRDFEAIQTLRDFKLKVVEDE
jgi:predicted nucleic acid-binding protein